MKKPYDIFISHDSRDKALAGKLKKFIERIFLQSNVYVSGENIQGGRIWYSNIQSAIKDSKVVITIITKNSINNNWVSFETGAGAIEDKSIPLVADGLVFNDLTNYPFSNIQARMFDEEGILNLIHDIAEYLEVRKPQKEDISGLEDFVKLEDVVMKAKVITRKLKRLGEERNKEDFVPINYANVRERIEKFIKSRFFQTDLAKQKDFPKHYLDRANSKELIDLAEKFKLQLPVPILRGHAKLMAIPSNELSTPETEIHIEELNAYLHKYEAKFFGEYRTFFK